MNIIVTKQNSKFLSVTKNFDYYFSIIQKSIKKKPFRKIQMALKNN